MDNGHVIPLHQQPREYGQLGFIIQNLYQSLRHETGGAVASHLPELSQANPDCFGLCAATLDGKTHEAGDSRLAFSIQSIAKPLILALALEDQSTDIILEKIGVEPTGERFDSIFHSGNQDTQRLNPFMNAGAIATLDLINARDADERFARICCLLRRLISRPVMIDHKALESRRRTDHHNRAIAYLLLGRGLVTGPVDDLLEVYHRICCISLECHDLAMIGAVLANNGAHPRSGLQVLQPGAVKTILSVMQTCGMYEFSGQWAYRVGLPAKSALSGAMLVPVPGRLGFAVYSPPLDETHQKSVRGLKACELLSERLGLHMFRSPVRGPGIKGRAGRRGLATVRRHRDMERLLARIHERTGNITDGSCYNLAPGACTVDPDAYAISITTVDGRSYRVGDHGVPFLMQSISKVFAYGLALEDHGRKAVLQSVDVEPSGNPYDAIIRLEQQSKRPHNPMVNPGGIATTALIKGMGPAHQLDRILGMYERYIGHSVDIDMRTYLAETRCGDRNKAIAYLLRHFGMLESEVNEALSLYLQQCSAVVNCDDLSVMAATLANDGVNPITGKRAIQADYIGDLLTVMYTCGMYDFSGEWSYRTGLPSKSGVSGGILAVVPGRMGIAVYSPRLDAHGNSIAGIRALEQISRELDLHMFSRGT